MHGPRWDQRCPPSREIASDFAWKPALGSPAQTAIRVPSGAAASTVESARVPQGSSRRDHVDPPSEVNDSVALAAPTAALESTYADDRLMRSSHVCPRAGACTAARVTVAPAGCERAGFQCRPPSADSSTRTGQDRSPAPTPAQSLETIHTELPAAWTASTVPNACAGAHVRASSWLTISPGP